MPTRDNPFLDLTAPGLPGLNPYVPGKPISELERELGIRDSIKLASNENPLGPGPKARAAVATAIANLSRYPDGGGFELRRALAARHGVDSAAITLGNGSSDVLDLVARAFLAPGSESVFSQHSFAVYPIATQAVGAQARVAKAKNYGHDLDAMASLVSNRTRVVWIANPNNPTGTWLEKTELYRFLAKLPTSCIIVIDEAYHEYVADPDYPDTSKWLSDFHNLIVTRTFSKVHGLAGLRIGYSMSDPRIAEIINRVRQPFNVNSVAQCAAAATISDKEHIKKSREINRIGMEILTEAFYRMGVEFIPSVGNFITINVARPANSVYETLLNQGIIVRPMGGYQLPTYLRVSIGLEADCLRFVDNLKAALLQKK